MSRYTHFTLTILLSEKHTFHLQYFQLTMGLSGHSLMAVRNIDAKGKLAICCDQWKIIPVTIV